MSPTRVPKPLIALTVALTVLLCLLVPRSIGAQTAGPFSAQIQAAFRSFGIQNVAGVTHIFVGGADTYVFGASVFQTNTSMILNGNATIPSNTAYIIASRAQIGATASKLVQVIDSGGTTGVEINGGTPTLGTCTGGALTSGSHNDAGEVTGTTGGSCVINFGAPNYTNAPFCTAIDESATPTALQLSARSNASITIANITSGHNIIWACHGRIGT